MKTCAHLRWLEAPCVLLIFFGIFVILTYCKAALPPNQQPQSSGCDKNIEISNGFPTFVDNGQVVLFECQSGFVPYGDMKATCNNHKGKWDAEPPKCIKKGCAQPKFPINGKGDEEFSGALIRFSCDSGFKLVGDDILTCNGKTWSSLPPLCTALPPQMIEQNVELKKKPEL